MIDTLTSVYIVEIANYGSGTLEVYEGFFWNNLEYESIQNLLLICLKEEINLN